MAKPGPRHARKPVPIGRLEFGVSKLGVRRYDLRDPYHLAVSLPWAGFAAAMLSCWLLLNVVFASLYMLSPGDIANARPGSFADLFFFSIETLATVGYGVMAPATPYGHIVSAMEIATGMAFTAIFTGLLFVRFSRPRANILAADNAVVATHNGRPALMLRIVTGRVTIMSNASARLFVLLAEQTAEGQSLRRIHELHLEQAHLPMFIMPWTLMHIIDDQSPLHGYDAEALVEAGGRIFLTIDAQDHALSAPVQDLKHYAPQQVRFGMRFADMVISDPSGGTTADLSRISLLEVDDHVPTVARFEIVSDSPQ